ncbi:MAG: glutamate--tRNA ligase [Candidatus Pacebacteria bacterium]|nr:glutamate--tRNA ligase [Candidatus Paceibacterota bacterium]
MDDLDLKFENPRARIAPSPTGTLHIGTARSALFNYLFSQKYGGKFILRIEDTDPARSEEKWVKDIIDGLKWLGISWDEGPNLLNSQEDIGEFGPYRQGKRKNIYAKYIQKLLDNGKAYYCFCSIDELEAQKQYLMSIGKPPIYNGKCRDLTKAQVEEYLKEKKSYVIRLKTPKEKIVFNDLVHGKVETDSELLGDMVIAKGLNDPLYNLAAVIDDFEMKITHVIRGEDHISNTPKQILLYQALDLPIPQFAHIPLILGPDRSKLSKRHGAVSVNQYREEGYLPEAMINFIAFLGWNPGDDREIYSINQLIKDFSLKNCHKSAAVFNPQKLLWLNGFYIRQKNITKLTELCIPYLIKSGLIKEVKDTEKLPPVFGQEPVGHKYLIIETKEMTDSLEIEKIILLYQERLKILSEIPELIDFFFKKELDYTAELLKWKDAGNDTIIKALSLLEEKISLIEETNWRRQVLLDLIGPEAEKFKDGNRGYLLWPLRAALSGKDASAGPFEIAEVLGKEKTLERIARAKEIIAKA